MHNLKDILFMSIESQNSNCLTVSFNVSYNF